MMTTLDKFLDRVRAFDFDRLEIARGQPMHERAITLSDMAIDEIESVIAGEPFLEATEVIVKTVIGEPSTPLPDSMLRIDNAVVLRDDGTNYYNLDASSDPIIEPWTGVNRGRPVGYFLQGETIFWDPPHPAQEFEVKFMGYFAVADLPDAPNNTDLFPLHDAYVNPTAALVAKLFEKSRGEDMAGIREYAYELLRPVINMRRRRKRAPTAGRFKWVNN